ncbi:expressed unknown protein [Seminavis robusta]|uniref:Uncharacterized protein n=1 Tax=Seminavis robusta TaxID=568900 RepID=A0A9N8HD06_9STRA|nr:expressed unknown protein [Seminavis robusta]|eukprot:Sro240_g096210.1 n/a (243) ;mRNA; f:84367-85095
MEGSQEVDAGGEGSFLRRVADEDDAGQHNYSATCRWRQRAKRCQEWVEEWKAKLEDSDCVLEDLTIPDRSELFLMAGGESSLGELLSECENFREELIEEYNNKENTQQAIRRRDQEFLWTKVRLVAARADSIQKAHNDIMKNQLALHCAKGNETRSTNESDANYSLDSRFDRAKEASPPAGTNTLDTGLDNGLVLLLARVSEQLQTRLQCFHLFVSALFKEAEETQDPAKVKNTTTAILAWE